MAARCVAGQFPHGTLILRVDEAWRPQVKQALAKLHQRQAVATERAGRPVLLDLDVSIEVDRQARSLDANRLMWWLYEVTAAAMQEGTKKEDLYRQDMEQYGPVITARVKSSELANLSRFGWTWKRAIPAGDDMMLVDLLVTSSKWDSVTMHRHIRTMIARLADLPIPLEYQMPLRKFFFEWLQSVGELGVELDDEGVTERSWRESNPFCMACGRFVARGGAERHHVRSRGAGGTEDPRRSMLLCGECHAVWNDTDGGPVAFVSRFPHLRPFVERWIGLESRAQRRT